MYPHLIKRENKLEHLEEAPHILQGKVFEEPHQIN